MNIHNAIREGTKFLRKNNVKYPELDSELLLAKVLRKEREYLILNLDKNVNEDNLKDYKDLIEERSFGKPIAYLTKKKKFLEFRI